MLLLPLLKTWNLFALFEEFGLTKYIALQCDYYHYAICYIGRRAVVVPLWLKHRFSVAVLPCKRGNASVIYNNVIAEDVYNKNKKNE